jgi:allantoinase
LTTAKTATAGPTRDLVGYEGRPPFADWPGRARIAISLTVNVEEGSEPAIGDGDPVREPSGPASWPLSRRDLAQEGAFAYGTRAGFWRLLDVFDEQKVKGTFFACAVSLERNPAAAREIGRRGHELVAHGYRWEDANLLTRDQERERIRLTVESITKTTGERPLGWRCRYAPSVHTRELLVEEGGFLYDSDAYNDDLPYWTTVGAKEHLVVPYSLASNDNKFGWGSFESPLDFERYLKADFDRLYQEGEVRPKMMSVGLHLRISGHPARAQAIANFIEYAKSFPDVWFARRIEIARHWLARHPR